MLGVLVKIMALLIFGGMCSRTDAQDRTFLVAAPLSFRLDAMEKVVLQLFGFSDPVTVYVFVRKTMADLPILRQQVTLKASDQHMGEVQFRLFPEQVESTMHHVILHVQSESFNQHVSMPLSRTNGFLLVQTDKPLYTPQEKVKVRAFSLNQELRPAVRSVFLTFRDPDYEKVDVVEVKDASNGMPSLTNPFRIPINPKLGVWTIEASYMEHFDTKASTAFEVREYVLPSFTILIEPEYSYVSHNNFQHFTFKVSAKYLHGAPVAEGEMFLRYGYASLMSSPVIIPSSVTRNILSPEGELEVTVDLQRVFSKHTQEDHRTVGELKDKYLYIAVLLREKTGGISQEAELRSVKFVQSPYTLGLVSTPPFIKPGLPYNIQVLVKDHIGAPVSGVPVRLVEKQMHRSGRLPEEPYCTDKATSRSEGIALFICNIQMGVLSIDLQFATDDPLLRSESQASLLLKAQSYESPNARYLYIDPSPIQTVIGSYTQIPVYSVAAPYLSVKSLNYLIMSKGKIVKYGSMPFGEKLENRHTLNFQVTAEMVPSIRLLVYYMPYGEQTTELVADAVWLNIQGECVNGLQTEMKTQTTDYKPQQNLEMQVKVNQDGHIAMVAVDKAIYSLLPNYKDPVKRVLHHFESADQGCGGGGGKNAADVFKLAGLSFMTNANSGQSSSAEPCTAMVRPKRAITEEQKKKILAKYKHPAVQDCCLQGMNNIPTFETCAQSAESRYNAQYRNCRAAFTDCCLYIQKTINQEYILGRAELGGDFEKVPTLVRSSFPESWLWQVRRITRGSMSLFEKLPDSLTTWHIKTVGMFDNGICIAKAAEVSVNLPLSVDVPLPYQIVRGEQVELKGSVYNQLNYGIRFCVTLTVGPELCLAGSQAASDGSKKRSTSCKASQLSGRGVGDVSFTLMALEAGSYTLTFTLYEGHIDRPYAHLLPRDIVVKTLTVVPEGVLKEEMVGGRLDPQGLYGSSKLKVELKSALPQNIVPNTEVRRELTINGEILDDFVSVVDNPAGLKKLLSLQDGSAVSELGGVLPLLYVYQYLETTGHWHILGPDDQKSSEQLKTRIRQGLAGVNSFRKKDFSYSMFMKKETSTWVTALAVHTLSVVNNIFQVDHESLGNSVNWLIHNAQKPDGSFQDTSLYKPNRIMALPQDNVERSVYLTSFVIIALHKATRIQAKGLNLKNQELSIESAMKFVHEKIRDIQKVYVLSVAVYASTLHNPGSATTSQLLTRLETLARSKGNPAELRYWQEPRVQTEWLRPDQSSAFTVETTAYALLSFLNMGRFQYCNPIVTWLTQDQHYGGGYFSLQDTLMTLEAVTVYSDRVPRAELDQNIRIRFSRASNLDQEVHLSKRAPVASPIQITKNSEVTATTAFGRGVSHVKLKTIYYQTVPPQENCNFNIKMELLKSGNSDGSLSFPHLVACAQYKPPPNEEVAESLLTVMEIQLPTGIEPFLEDLRPLMDMDNPIVASYRMNGRTVLINIYAVPSDRFMCVGFRIRTAFVVGGTSDTVFTVYEEQDQASKCIKLVSDQEQKIHRLCQFDQCQCVSAICSPFRGTIDPSITQEKLNQEICHPGVKYAYKVKVTNIMPEGDFLTHTVTIQEVIKSKEEFEAVRARTEVDFIKKATCNTVDLQKDQQYLISGSSGLEVVNNQDYRFRFPLDSDTLIQVWPLDCGEECVELVKFSLLTQIYDC
ncbi:complement C5 [Periophthalmus magnuspinnatus]|uniref:complement C5 n=1 Tax=Periophthalmus magnuspinnatus TaxID=409849 RepID=UPI0024373EC4|nr:complement C5 [Periophthalmus magnuspinnatus]